MYISKVKCDTSFLLLDTQYSFTTYHILFEVKSEKEVFLGSLCMSGDLEAQINAES